MAINPETQYPGKVEPATPANPFGTARNITTPGDGTGTPWESAIQKDNWAFQHAMLLNAGMEPNGTPDVADNSQLFKAAKASIGNGANLLSNHNFLIASPDDSQPPPDATPRSYPPGFQIFSGVFANETTGITDLTYIDGRVSFTAGDFYMPVANTGAIARLTAADFSASVADFDGKPRTRGVSFALVGDEYRVTVGVDALEDTDGNATPLGSVKFEQGSVATGHDVDYGVVSAGSATPRLIEERFTDSVNVLDFEHLVTGSDWSQAFEAAFSLGVSISSPVVIQGTFSASQLTIPANCKINANCEIMCLSDVTTITIMDDVTINGKFLVDGNNVLGASGTSRVLVSGDDVEVEKFVFNNISSDLDAGESPTYGCTVTGDNFSAGHVKSSFGGYSPIRLLITKEIKTFSIQKISSIDYWYKGFVVNGSGFDCNSIFIDDYYAEYNGSTDGTDGFLVDTDDDATITNIKSLVVNKLETNGGEANGCKIQNVENLNISYLKAKLEDGVNIPRFGFTIAARNCEISYADTDWFINVFSQDFNCNYLNTSYAPSADRVIQFDDPYWSGVTYSYNIGHLSAKFDADDAFKVLRFESGNSNPYYSNIGHLECIADPISIGNIPSNGQEGNLVKIDKLTGYTGVISTGSSAKDRLIQVGAQPQRFTSVDVQDINSVINTTNKVIGKPLFLTDTFETVFAAQISPGATWRYSDGTTAYTPS